MDLRHKLEGANKPDQAQCRKMVCQDKELNNEIGRRDYAYWARYYSTTLNFDPDVFHVNKAETPSKKAPPERMIDKDTNRFATQCFQQFGAEPHKCAETDLSLLTERMEYKRNTEKKELYNRVAAGMQNDEAARELSRKTPGGNKQQAEDMEVDDASQRRPFQRAHRPTSAALADDSFKTLLSLLWLRLP